MLGGNLIWVRIIGFLEGISAFVLFCIAMPMKHIFQSISKEAFFNIGLAHGLLWVAYALVATFALFAGRITHRQYLLLGIASMFPLGPIVADRIILKRDPVGTNREDSAIRS